MGQDKATVLVVDDDAAVRRGLYWALRDNYCVLEAGNRTEAVARARELGLIP